jgi:hypothetical protein
MDRHSSDQALVQLVEVLQVPMSGALPRWEVLAEGARAMAAEAVRQDRTEQVLPVQHLVRVVPAVRAITGSEEQADRLRAPVAIQAPSGIVLMEAEGEDIVAQQAGLVVPMVRGVVVPHP